MSTRVRKSSDIPGWFDLTKYAGSQSLDAAGWYEQLVTRSQLIRLFESISHADDMPSEGFKELHNFICEMFGFFQKNPLIDIFNDDRTKIYFSDASLLEIKSKKPRGSFGVTLVTMAELYCVERTLDKEKRDYIRNWAGQNYNNEKQNRQPVEWKDWFDDPISSHLALDSFGYMVRVNPLIPENVLVEQFQAMLRVIRKDGSFCSPPRPNFTNWSKFGVLPFIDLWIWACLNDMDIPNRVMADAIFPAGEGGEEVVRKTTAKLAWELMSSPNLETLAAIASSNNSEEKWA